MRPSGPTFEEVRWLGRGGRFDWRVSDVDFDLPFGKGHGIKLRWMSDASPHEEGNEAILAPGVGIVFLRTAVVPCRGSYVDHRQSLLSFEK